MRIMECVPGDELWPLAIRHLDETDNLRWIQRNGEIRPDIIVIVALRENTILGHISLIKQEITVPGEPAQVLKMRGEALWETFVQTFHVDEGARNQGIGTALQEAAVKKTRDLRFYQIRSWSSLDKEANYAVKLRLGFSFHPAVHTVKLSSQQIPGGFFIKKV